MAIIMVTGVIVGITGGGLATLGGVEWPLSIGAGATAFAVTVTLGVTIAKFLT
ncbi:hypothetical protein AB0J43_01420 [Nonomuraea fuscirosea]